MVEPSVRRSLRPPTKNLCDSRAEQLRQALAANPEARYSMEELQIADAFEDLPADMRKRLLGGEETGE